MKIRFTWFTNMAHPKKRSFCPKSLLYLPRKKVFKRRKYSIRLKEPITWHTHLTHPKNKLLTNQSLLLTQKSKFSNEKLFHTCLKEPIFYLKKKLAIRTRKNNQRKNLYNHKNRQFSKQEISDTCLKS